MLLVQDEGRSGSARTKVVTKQLCWKGLPKCPHMTQGVFSSWVQLELLQIKIPWNICCVNTMSSAPTFSLQIAALTWNNLGQKHAKMNSTWERALASTDFLGILHTFWKVREMHHKNWDKKRTVAVSFKREYQPGTQKGVDSILPKLKVTKLNLCAFAFDALRWCTVIILMMSLSFKPKKASVLETWVLQLIKPS